MKKVVTASILVAFIGAVAFASLQSSTSSKQLNNKEQKKEVKKEQQKKKESKRTCVFSM
jgi:Ni/Co efflux regulator RcnB